MYIYWVNMITFTSVPKLAMLSDNCQLKLSKADGNNIKMFWSFTKVSHGLFWQFVWLDFDTPCTRTLLVAVGSSSSIVHSIGDEECLLPLLMCREPKILHFDVF